VPPHPTVPQFSSTFVSLESCSLLISSGDSGWALAFPLAFPGSAHSLVFPTVLPYALFSFLCLISTLVIWSTPWHLWPFLCDS
jgi:hypothetical protein